MRHSLVLLHFVRLALLPVLLPLLATDATRAAEPPAANQAFEPAMQVLKKYTKPLGRLWMYLMSLVFCLEMVLMN